MKPMFVMCCCFLVVPILYACPNWRSDSRDSLNTLFSADQFAYGRIIATTLILDSGEEISLDNPDDIFAYGGPVEEGDLDVLDVRFNLDIYDDFDTGFPTSFESVVVDGNNGSLSFSSFVYFSDQPLLFYRVPQEGSAPAFVGTPLEDVPLNPLLALVNDYAVLKRNAEDFGEAEKVDWLLSVLSHRELHGVIEVTLERAPGKKGRHSKIVVPGLELTELYERFVDAWVNWVLLNPGGSEMERYLLTDHTAMARADYPALLESVGRPPAEHALHPSGLPYELELEFERQAAEDSAGQALVPEDDVADQ